MTDQNSNPFVLPGMGQGSADMAGNPLLASMEMMRQAWAGLTGPGGLAQVMPMTAPMNVQELERRIAELRAVESWLRMNLSMLSSTIQGMEVQRSTIATLRSFVDNLSTQGQDPARWGDASPLEIVLGLKPAPGGASAATGGQARETRAAAGPGPETHARSTSQPSADAGAQAADAGAGVGAAAEGAGAASAGSAQAISQAAQSASEAWWGMLQQQFNQLAAATAASMPPMPGGTAAGSAQQGAPASGAAATGSSSAAKRGGAAKPASAPASRAAPRKTAVRKNKIQSDPDQS